MKRLLIAIAAVIAIGVIVLIVAVSLGSQRSGDSDNEQTTAAPSVPRTTAPLPGASPDDSAGLRCSAERGAVKLLSDPDIAQVSFAPVPATIDQLRAIAAPKQLPTTGRVKPAELATYTVTGVVTAIKAEADADYHLVLEDPASHHTIIIESVDPRCSTAAPQLRGEMAKARADIVAAFGRPSTTAFTSEHQLVTVTGVLFLDVLHGQRGVAPNGVEIHPILSFVRGQP